MCKDSQLCRSGIGEFQRLFVQCHRLQKKFVAQQERVMGGNGFRQERFPEVLHQTTKLSQLDCLIRVQKILHGCDDRSQLLKF